MSSLHLFFAGLIAFVPSSDRKNVDVLLLDASDEYKVDSCTSMSHVPELVVYKANVENGQSCPCRYAKRAASEVDKEFCVWRLDDAVIRFRGLRSEQMAVAQGRTGGFLSRKSAVPEVSAESADFSWLADMDAVIPAGGGIRSEGGIRDQIAARLRVDQGFVQTCHLVEVGESTEARVPIFEIRELGVGNAEVSYRQALTDEVEVSTDMETEHLIVYLDYSDHREVAIHLRATAGVLDMAILNLPEPHCSYSRAIECSETDVGIDFARFLGLATFDTAKRSFFLPHRTNEFRKGVQPDCYDDIVRDYVLRPRAAGACDENPAPRSGCGGIVTVFTRPICPMALFSR